jgi:hypothetical protein
MLWHASRMLRNDCLKKQTMHLAPLEEKSEVSIAPGSLCRVCYDPRTNDAIEAATCPPWSHD